MTVVNFSGNVTTHLFKLKYLAFTNFTFSKSINEI